MEEMRNSRIIVGDFNIPLSVIDSKKFSKNIEDMNNTITIYHKTAE